MPFVLKTEDIVLSIHNLLPLKDSVSGILWVGTVYSLAFLNRDIKIILIFDLIIKSTLKNGKRKEKSLIISWPKDNKSLPPVTAHTACADTIWCVGLHNKARSGTGESTKVNRTLPALWELGSQLTSGDVGAPCNFHSNLNKESTIYSNKN